MLKSLRPLFWFSLAATFVLTSCDMGYRKTDGGLKFRILADSAGENLDTGDVAFIVYTMKTGDTVFMDSRMMGQPYPFRVSEPTYKGSLEEGFRELSLNDSAVFVFGIDSFMTKMVKADSLPPFMKAGEEITMHLKVERVIKRQEIEEREKSRIMGAKLRKEGDSIAIINYLNEKKKTFIRTEVGSYVADIRNMPGAAKIQKGDSVSIMYKGMFFENGQVFDTNLKEEGKPLVFQAGEGFVIRGLDAAFAYLTYGSSATVYIPSDLAYGEQGGGSIPPNAKLIFEIKVLKR